MRLPAGSTTRGSSTSSPSLGRDDVERARSFGQLVLEVSDLQDHQEPVLWGALQGGQRLLRHDRLDRARNLPPPAGPGPSINNATASLPASSGPRPPPPATFTTFAGGRAGLTSNDAPPSDWGAAADTTNRVSASPIIFSEPVDLLGEGFSPLPPRDSSSIRSPPDPFLGRAEVDAINASFASAAIHFLAAPALQPSVVPAGAPTISPASLPLEGSTQKIDFFSVVIFDTKPPLQDSKFYADFKNVIYFSKILTIWVIF